MLQRKMAQDTDGKGRVSMTVRVSEDGLRWSFAHDSILETRLLKFKHIIGTRVSSREADGVLHVHYVAVIVGKVKDVLLRQQTISFLASDAICSEMSRSINKRLKETQSHRPRRLLVFVNPMSGSQNSMTSYEHVVKPLFDYADVIVHCIETTHASHPSEVLTDYDLSTIDGVISMGGDGSYGHVFNGLMRKTMKDAGADVDDETVEPVIPRVPFGVLPSGSGSALSWAASGAPDLVTATLSIILGKKLHADMTAVRQKDSLVAYMLFIAMNGTYSRVFNIVDSFRWLRKARYSLLIPALWWCFVLDDTEIEYLPVPQHKKQIRYATPSNIDADKSRFITVDGPSPGWKTFKGKIPSIFAVNSFMLSFIRWATTSPYRPPNMSTGTFQLTIDKVQSFWELAKIYLTKRNSSDTDDGIPPEVREHFEVSEIKVRTKTQGESRANLTIEAEPYDVLEYSLKVYKKRYEIFVIDNDVVSEILD